MTQIFRLCALGAVLAPAALAHAQSTEPPTFLDRQLARTDFSVSATGEISSNTTGTNYLNQTVTLNPSTTVGFWIGLRYSYSAFKGVEINYHQARFTDNYNVSSSPTVANQTPLALAIQTNAAEYSVGYLVHTPKQYFGLQPYASVGIGAMDFRPTPGGGQGLPKEGVRSEYYTLGVDSPVYYNHLGLRVGFRQTFFLKPDYFQNYLTDNKHEISSEPTIGFFIRF